MREGVVKTVVTQYMYFELTHIIKMKENNTLKCSMLYPIVKCYNQLLLLLLLISFS